MINYLSINKQYKYIIGYLIIIILSLSYISFEYKNISTLLQEEKTKEILIHYNFYKKNYLSFSKQKDILIENIEYIYQNDLINEFSKSTPIMINKEEYTPPKYDLTFKFFDKNTQHTFEIETKIASLKNDEYFQYFEKNTISLFGKVDQYGYVLITKQLQKYSQINSKVSTLFIKLFIIVLFNFTILFYLLHLVKTDEKNKEQLLKEFEQLQVDTKKVAFEDTLTGAATRLKFDETLKDLINIASRFKEQKFTAIMLDIDNFKLVNDTYGHDYGDIVLQEVSKVIKEHIRTTDTFARWGGEEFVILSPMNNLKDSLIFANKIRELIENIQFEKLEQITCSFGLVEFQENDTEQTLMKRADELLYKAKQNGKNRVEYN